MYNSGPRRSRQAIKLHLYNGHFKGDLSSLGVASSPRSAQDRLHREDVVPAEAGLTEDLVLIQRLFVFDKSPFQDPQ